ncbi:MAG: class II glutamine amidotransferase [Planctomycetes bacterium]|nr:class II glutamine amidotransferase [Planctomycetota bacterium]
MCRFIVYLGQPIGLGELLIEPVNSLIHQSFHSYASRSPVNADGFGIGWYSEQRRSTPALFRSISPAWSNHNLRRIAGATFTDVVLAHVRAASTNTWVSEANCHPFVHDRYLFMHNGEVGGFRAVRRKLLSALSDGAFETIEGSTDSEHVFALFLDRLYGIDAVGVDRLAIALRATIRALETLAEECGVDEPSTLNLAISDGRCAVVSRYSSAVDRESAPSLYYHTGHRYRCRSGACEMVSARPGEHDVIVSSEPLSEDEGWEEVPPNHFALVDEARALRLEPI